MSSSGEQLHPKHHIRQAYRHYWQDGIFEILIGIGLTLYTLFLLLTIRIEPSMSHTLQNITGVLAATLVMFCGIVIIRIISERMKSNIAYPRTGFVSLRSQRRNLTARSVVLALVITPVFAAIGLAVGIGLLYLFAQLRINISLVLMSAMFASPAAIMGWRTGLARLYWLAGGILLVGGLLTAAHISGAAGLVLLYGLTGVLVSISGCLAFVIYLRRHPVHNGEEAADGDL